MTVPDINDGIYNWSVKNNIYVRFYFFAVNEIHIKIIIIIFSTRYFSEYKACFYGFRFRTLSRIIIFPLTVLVSRRFSGFFMRSQICLTLSDAILA